MKNYQELALRYMHSNRKRTLLTLVGIILSVALICSTGLFFKGMQEAQIRYYKETIGSYHLLYTKLSEEDAFRLRQNPKIEKAGYVYQGEAVKISEELSLMPIVAEDEATLSMLPYQVKEGRLPKQVGEIAAEEWLLRSVQKKAEVGSRISIGETEYLVTGILKNNAYNQMEGKGIGVFSKSDRTTAEKIFLVQIDPKVSIKKTLEELESFAEASTVNKNHRLLAAQGVSTESEAKKAMAMTIGTIIGIIVVSTVALIYNSFQISLVERVRQFGLLRAIGAGKKQIRKLVFREAALLGVSGSLIGALFGVLALYIVMQVAKILLPAEVFHRSVQLSLSWRIIGMSILIGIVTVLISAFLPAHYAGKTTPLIAISGRDGIHKEKIRRSRRSWIGRWIGFEGELAIKNMKRNRKRYHSTVLSVTIGVILFVTTSYFVELIDSLNEAERMDVDVHFSIEPAYRKGKDSKREGIFEEAEDKIRAVKGIGKVYNVYEGQLFAAEIDEEKRTLEEDLSVGRYFESSEKGKIRLFAEIVPVSESVLEWMAKDVSEGRVKPEELLSSDSVILIRENLLFGEDGKVTKEPIADWKVGDEISLSYTGTQEEVFGSQGENVTPNFSKEESRKVKIVAVTDQVPLQIAPSERGIKLIASKEAIKRLIGNKAKLMSMHMMLEDSAREERIRDELTQITQESANLQFIDWADEYRTMRSGMLLIKILLYGFSLVVSLIGCANIVNTITTGIILRKREMGILRAVGFTSAGLRKTILIEGIFYGVQGVFFGSVLATGLSYLIFSGISGMIDKGGFIPPYPSIGIAFVLAMGIGVLSVLSPLRRIQEENLTEAIRQEG